jgi:hypothetical protein
MTTHDETVLAAHLGTAHLAESLRQWKTHPTLDAGLDSIRSKLTGGTMTTDTREALIIANNAEIARREAARSKPTKGATMTTAESPAEQVARLAAETEGAQVLFRCAMCGTGVGIASDRCCGGPLGLDSGDFGPYYYFPPTKPAPPSSRETLAANVRRLREAKGWKIECLLARLPSGYQHSTKWLETVERSDFSEDHVNLAELADLAAALDTTPAELLTPQETDT